MIWCVPDKIHKSSLMVAQKWHFSALLFIYIVVNISNLIYKYDDVKWNESEKFSLIIRYQVSEGDGCVVINRDRERSNLITKS